MSEVEIKGVMAIITLSDGHVCSSYGDFDKVGYGGFRLSEAQAMRAGRVAKIKAVQAFVGPAMAAWLSDYTIDRIINDMRDKGGARITYVPIGWQGEDADRVTSRSERP